MARRSPQAPPRHLEERVAAVGRVVRAIPHGEVLSYSQVALRAGMPGNPRGVVKALKSLENAPWWRVIRADGTVAPEMAFKQLARLRQEGHVLRGRRVRPATARQSSSYRSIKRPPA